MAFNFSQSMSSIFGSKKPTTTLPTPIKPVDYSNIMKPNSTVPNIMKSMSAPSVPSFATSASTTSPTTFGPQAIPQVKATVATPKPTTPVQSAPVAPVSNAGNFTTPSGAVVDAKGNMITPPPDASGSSQNASGGTNRPATPIIAPETQKALDTAEKAYQESLKISPEELSTQEDLDKLVDSTKKGYLATSGQAIPMEFITGQLKSIEERATNLAEPLERKLARLQAQRTSALESNKFALERTQKKVDAEKDAKKPIAGTSFYDPTTGTFIQAPSTSKSNEGFTLSPGEKRYDAAGNLIAEGGAKPMTQAQETAAIAKTEKETAAQQSASQSIGLVNNLLAGDAYAKITGVGQNPLNLFGVTNAKELNNYNQLQGLLKLGIRGLLKGQGAVSDYEGKILGQAASALGRNLGDADFKQALLQIRGVLQTNNGGTTNVIVRDKNGKVLGQGELNGQDIYDAVNDGNTIEYL